MPQKTWPQRILDDLGRAPRVGDWFGGCCVHHLTQVRSTELLGDLLDNFNDPSFGDTGGKFFKTRAEGVTYLRKVEKADADSAEITDLSDAMQVLRIWREALNEWLGAVEGNPERLIAFKSEDLRIVNNALALLTSDASKH